MNELTLTLKPESPFYSVFPNGIVPVRGPVTQSVFLEGVGLSACYFLDGSRCTAEQIDELIGALAANVGARTMDVRDEICAAIEAGLPIREMHVALPPGISLRFIL